MTFDKFDQKKQFQYKFLELSWLQSATFERLNKLGEEGWEIISIVKVDDHPTNRVFYVTLKHEY